MCREYVDIHKDGSIEAQGKLISGERGPEIGTALLFDLISEHIDDGRTYYFRLQAIDEPGEAPA